MRSFSALQVLVLFFALACNHSASNDSQVREYDPDRIYGSVSDLPGKKILLYSLYGDEVKLIDSVMAGPNGKFVFHFPPEMQRGLYRLAMGKSTLPGHYDQHRQFFDLIWDGNTVAFHTNYAMPVDSMNILLSSENTLYYHYLRRMISYEEKLNVLNSALINYPQGNSFYRKLEREHRKVQNRRSNYVYNLVKKYRGTIFSAIAFFSKVPVVSSPVDGSGDLDKLKDDFFIEGQFKDPVILYTDLLPSKIMRYLSLYTGGISDDKEKQDRFTDAVDVIMQHAVENEKVFYYVLEYLMNGFESMDMDLVTEHLTSRYLLGDICFEDGIIADRESFASVSEMKAGSRVPGFSFKALDGRLIDLREIEAEHTLILFWGSWCPHCETIMDDLYELYNSYRNEEEGFLEVVAIGIEDDEQEWLDHIQNGGYDWINYSSLKRWDCPVARGYELLGTPTMILLDSNKRFISEPMRIRALKRDLEKLQRQEP